MDEEELRQLYDALRVFASEYGLDWVVAEVDESAALGVVEVQRLQQTTRRGEQVYVPLDEIKSRPGSRKSAEQFLTTRPMTVREQVEVLLQAFRRVLVDLDGVAAASVSQLQELPVPPDDVVDPVERDLLAATEYPPARANASRRVTEIDFLPDDGSTRPGISTEGARFDDRRLRAAEALSHIERDVRR